MDNVNQLQKTQGLKKYKCVIKSFILTFRRTSCGPRRRVTVPLRLSGTSSTEEISAQPEQLTKFCRKEPALHHSWNPAGKRIKELEPNILLDSNNLCLYRQNVSQPCTLQVVLLGNGQGQKADMAEGGRPVATAKVDQTNLGGILRVSKGQDHHQQEAHGHYKLHWKKIKIILFQIKTSINTYTKVLVEFSGNYFSAISFHCLPDLDCGSQNGELRRLSSGLIGFQDLLDEPLDLPLRHSIAIA